MKYAGTLAVGLVMLASQSALAKVVFSDHFNSGGSAAWGDESGQWRAVKGTYDASIPGNGQTHPVTYTDVTTETALTNFTLTVTGRSI